jgi:small subunit ribosomal protein S20
MGATMSLAGLDSWHEWMQPSAPASAPEDVAMLGVFSPPSTKKRIRQAEKKRVYNRSWKSRMRTEIKKLLVAVEAEQVDVAKAQFPTTVSVIQRVVKRGIIHKNKGSRLVSRLHLKYKKLTSRSGSPPRRRS